MTRDMEQLLSICLDQLEQGDSIEAILGRYPGEAAILRPYLETAVQISQLAAQPTFAAQQKSQAAFLAKAAVLSSPQPAPTPILVTLRRLFLPVASLAVVLLLLGAALISVSGSALPGDGLYSVKRVIEEFRLMRATEPDQIINLSEQFQQERLREIEALLRAGREEDVLFVGDIEAIGSAEWIVSGLPVQIEANTTIEGTASIGELARVDGRTMNGLLIAGRISVLTGSPGPEETPLPLVVPTVKATPVPDPSATPSAAHSETISTTPSAPLDLQATPTVTPEPIPSATVTIGDSPVAPPTNDDGSSGNGSDDGTNNNGNDGTNNNDNEGAGNNDNNANNNDNKGDNNNNNNANNNDNEGDNNNNNANNNDNEGDNNNNNANNNDNEGDNNNNNANKNDNEGDNSNNNNANNNDNEGDNNNNNNANNNDNEGDNNNNSNDNNNGNGDDSANNNGDDNSDNNNNGNDNDNGDDAGNNNENNSGSNDNENNNNDGHSNDNKNDNNGKDIIPQP